MACESQRRRDDNKNKIIAFEGGGALGQRGQSSKSTCFRGKRHDNKHLKVQILLSRNIVVIAQAPRELTAFAERQRLAIGDFAHLRCSPSMVHLGAAAGDPHALLFSTAYIFMRIMAKCKKA